jgi:hypothetical protein
MAVVEAVLSICSRYIERNMNESEENKCQNCFKLTEYIKVPTSELKSAQVINKILSEELKQIVNEHKNTENQTYR